MTEAGRSSPDVSILIVSWNTKGLTEACLRSLPGSVSDAVDYEVIVVDNGSTDGSVELLRGQDAVQLVENGANRGYATAVNQAYARATGRLILLLNSDIEFEPLALSTLVDFLAEHPDVAGVGPLYLNPDGSPQLHHFRLPTWPMLLAGSSRIFAHVPPLAAAERRYRMVDDDFTQPRPIEQPSASVLLLRREVLPPDHVLDEAFPIFFNDVELAWRLRRAGHELWMTPQSRAYHVHGASTRQLGPALQRQHLAALVRYLDRTHSPAARIAFKALVFPPKAMRSLLGRGDAPSLGELVAAMRGDPGDAFR